MDYYTSSKLWDLYFPCPNLRRVRLVKWAPGMCRFEKQHDSEMKFACIYIIGAWMEPLLSQASYDKWACVFFWYGVPLSAAIVWILEGLVNYIQYDDVIKWKHFQHYWPFVRGLLRSPMDSPHKGQWRGASVFSFICASTQLSKQWRRWWF